MLFRSDRLLEMFASLDADARLDIYGDGAERSALERQALALGIADRVAMPGFIRDPWSSLAGADAFLMPSRWEGMPNAALEALALGVPVIATPQAGGLEEVTAACTPGTLTLADVGAPFVSALRALSPRRDAGLRPSLLPGDFDLAEVIPQFERLLLP